MPGHRRAIAGGKMSPIFGETVRRQNTADELARYLPFPRSTDYDCPASSDGKSRAGQIPVNSVEPGCKDGRNENPATNG